MGATIREVNEKSNGIIEQTNGDRGGKAGKSSSTTTTTGGSGGGIGGSGGNTTTTTTTNTKEQSKDFSRLAILTESERQEFETADEERKKIIIRNAKRRERYWKEKEQGKDKKPKQVRKSSKNNNPKISSEQLTLIIGGISTAIASRKGCEQWLLTEEETKSITEPLSKMIEESSLFENIGQYSNQIALVTACITIFTPRIFITIQKMREGKKRGITRQQTNTTVRDERIVGTEKASNTEINRRDIKKPTSVNGYDGKAVSWYGDPIC